jgi:hypothetical protein
LADVPLKAAALHEVRALPEFNTLKLTELEEAPRFTEPSEMVPLGLKEIPAKVFIGIRSEIRSIRLFIPIVFIHCTPMNQ